MIMTLAFAIAAGCTNDRDEDQTTPEPAPSAEETPDMPDASVTATLSVDSLADVGSFLTDADGRALYLFEADSARESTCYDACTAAWPPLTTTGTPTISGPGIQQDMIGTIQRRDGTTQATYNGWPLYHYASDPGPGQHAGQGVEEFGGEWYLVAPGGSMVHRGS
jgi:predicted lipoprotein with Yx(FWY)xxD motif